MTLEELHDRISELDPSDEYHADGPELDALSYYEAISRVLRLVRGDITDWTDKD